MSICWGLESKLVDGHSLDNFVAFIQEMYLFLGSFSPPKINKVLLTEL